MQASLLDTNCSSIQRKNINTYFNFPNLVLLCGICFEKTKHFNNYLQHTPSAMGFETTQYPQLILTFEDKALPHSSE